MIQQASQSSLNPPGPQEHAMFYNPMFYKHKARRNPSFTFLISLKSPAALVFLKSPARQGKICTLTPWALTNQNTSKHPALASCVSRVCLGRDWRQVGPGPRRDGCQGGERLRLARARGPGRADRLWEQAQRHRRHPHGGQTGGFHAPPFLRTPF